MRATPEQLEALRKASACLDYEKARAIVENAGITESTTFTTPEQKKLALRARLAMYSDNDKGRFGKIKEIEVRIDRSNALNRPIAWREYRAHMASKNDATFYINDGANRVAIEVKSGAGDGFAVKTANKAKAIAQLKKLHKIIIWDTDYFTIVLPADELVNALEHYNKGVDTFFKQPTKKEAGYNLPIQEWNTSKRKIAFLETIAESSYSYHELVFNSRLVRR